MLGFNTEAQGCLPCKIIEEAQKGALWTVDCLDDAREDRSKREEEPRPFEEAGWWYRITGKTLVKRIHHCLNTDGAHWQWSTREEWKPVDWNKRHGNLKCVECHEHNRGREKLQGGGSRLKERGWESLRRILIHGKHFPFLTPEEREKRGPDH